MMVSSVLLLMIPIHSSCINQSNQPNETNQTDECCIEKDSLRFIVGKHDALLSFEVSIGNSSNVVLALDTGNPGLTLDKDLCLSIFNMDSLRRNCLCTTEQVEYSYASLNGCEECIYYPINVIISGDTLMFERFFVADGFAEEFGVDGLFTLPSKYDKKVVFDFSGGCYDITENCDTSRYDFSVEIEKEWYFTVLKDFPFSFGDDSLTTGLVLDTGTGSYTIAMLGQCAFNAVLKDYHPVFDDDDYQSYYLIKETGVLNDTIKIYKNRMARSFDKPIVGLDFLFRFDLCWDVSGHKMWFKKNQNRDFHAYFQQHGAVVHGIRLITNNDCTSAMVKRIGLDDNAYTSGIRPYDILIKVGEKPFGEASIYYRKYCKENGLTCHFEVLRNGNVLTFDFLP